MGFEITFAIPFYRGKAYLRETLASVFAQSDGAWRVVVHDEGGEDSGIDDVLAAFDPGRIRHVRNPTRLGIVGNWNACLQSAETPFVTLLHADDRLLPNYVALMREAFAFHPHAVAAFCDTRIIDGRGAPAFSFPDAVKRRLYTPPLRTRFGLVQGEAGVADLLKGCYIFCPTLCYQKAVLGPRRFSADWSMVQDLEMETRLLLENETLVRAGDVAYEYRRHAANATVGFTENAARFHEEIALYDRLGKQVQERGWARAEARARGKWVIKLNLAFCLLKDALAVNGRAFQEKAVLLRSLLP